MITALLVIYTVGCAVALLRVMWRMFRGTYPFSEEHPPWVLVKVQLDVFGWPIQLVRAAAR